VNCHDDEKQKILVHGKKMRSRGLPP
jgi:hypothetical protein